MLHKTASPYAVYGQASDWQGSCFSGLKKKKKPLKMSFVHVEWGIVRSMLDFKQINTDFSVLLLYFFKRIKNKGFFLVLNIPRGKMDGTDL